MLHCITLIYRNEKNSRLKKKKRLESSYESEDRKTFSTSISHHGTKAIYTLLYISSIISISIWLIHNRDDIEIHCFFPLGSPNFLSFFLSFYFHWRSNCEESGGLFLPAGRNCLFRKRKKWRHLRVPGEQRGTIFAWFPGSDPEERSPLSGIPSYLGRKLSLSLSLSRPAPSRATLDTSLVPNLAPVLHGSRKASPPPSLPHSVRSRPGFRGELFGAREKIPRTAHDDESVTENDTCPVAVPRFSSTDRSNHFFSLSLSLSRSRWRAMIRGKLPQQRSIATHYL